MFKKIKSVFFIAITILLLGSNSSLTATTNSNTEISSSIENQKGSQEIEDKNTSDQEKNISTTINETDNNKTNSDSTEQNENAPNVNLIQKETVSQLLTSVTDENNVIIVDGEVNPKTGEFENYSEKYWQIELTQGFFIKFPERYGEKKEIIDALQSGILTGIPLDGSNPLSSFKPFSMIGGWDVPLLSAYDTNGVLRPVYCIDGKLNYPGIGSYPSWGTVGSAMEGALYYVVSDLTFGYPQNYEGRMQGAIDEQQTGTGGAIWWDMSVYRGNPDLDWSNASVPGSSGYSAYHEQSTAGSNMRYLVDKGNYIPDVLAYINGTSSGTVSSDSSLATINGVKYQASEWFDVTGGNLSFSIPTNYRLQVRDGSIYGAGNHNINSGGSFRILNVELADDGDWNTGMSSDLKKLGFLYGVTGGGSQDVVMGLSTDPIDTPSIYVKWHEQLGNVRGIKNHQNDTINPYVFDFSKYTVKVYDDTNTEVASTVVKADGTWGVDDLLIGDYTFREINTDTGIVVVNGAGKFTIIPGETINVASAENLINRVAYGTVEMSKFLENESTEQYAVDYTKFGYKISGGGITKDYWLNKDNFALSDKLKFGLYTWEEISKDKGTAFVKSSGTFEINKDGQVINLTNGKGAVNEVAYANIEITKKDADWLTAILKPAVFGAYAFNEETGATGEKLDEITVNFLNAKGIFNNIQIGPSGKRTIIIKELVAPDGYFKDDKGILVTLTTENHKQTIEVDYFNVPEFFTSPEVIKYNDKGQVMDDVPFKLEEIDKNGNVVKLIETLRTSSQGTTRFQNVPSNNQDNESICYRITELRDESNKLYILDEPYEFCGSKDVKIVRYQAINNPKMFNYPIWKIAESNPVGIAADDSIFGLYNNKDELIQEVTIQNNTASINGLTHEEITDGMYWKEISVGDQALVLDTNKYYVQNVDWLNMEDGTTLTIQDNTESTPIVNRIKTIALSGFKVNEYAQRLLGVDFALYSEDTETEATDSVEATTIQHKVEDVETDVNGKFTTSYYPIYLFDGIYLDYMQETATLENLVLVTQKYEVPTILANEYAKYSDKGIVEISTEINPIVNYNLRLGLGLYKVNEDKEFLPGVEYGLYDKEKRELATGVTNEEGMLLIENIRFDIFINRENPTAKTVEVYIGEIKTQSDDKFVLDPTPYYLPNLYGKQDDYNMSDIIMLNTKETAYVNMYLRGEIALAKLDEADHEKKLANATFRFERLSGADVPEVIEETTSSNEETSSTNEETTDVNEVPATPIKTIDVKQSFEIITNEHGEIIAGELLYGDWRVTEINAPDGYVLPEDADGNPTNSATVKIDKKTQKVLLKFYNNKKPEILVVTGEDETSKLLMLLIGGEVIILSIVLLYFGMRRKNAKKHIARGVLSLVVLLSGTMFASVQTQAAPLKPLVEVSQQPKSIVSNTVDPIDEGEGGKTDPIDRTGGGGEDNPSEEIEVEAPTTPESPSPGSTEGGTTEPSVGKATTIDYDKYTNSDELANTGEPVLMYVAVGLAIITLGAIFLVIVKIVKRKKEVV